MLRTIQANSYFLLLSLSTLCSTAYAFDFPAEYDLNDRPAPIWPTLKQSTLQRQNEQSAVPLTKDWDFGLPFRIESFLCRKFSQVDCPSFAEDQSCKIDFELIDNSKIKNVRVSSHSKVPAFDSLTKKLILASIGSSELKLPKSQVGKTVSVSSTFYKAGTSRWVVVSFGTANKDKDNNSLIPSRSDPYFYGYRKQQPDAYKTLPWPKDRQVEYKNENGETRFKLVPVDNSTR